MTFVTNNISHYRKFIYNTSTILHNTDVTMTQMFTRRKNRL